MSMSLQTKENKIDNMKSPVTQVTTGNIVAQHNLQCFAINCKAIHNPTTSLIDDKSTDPPHHYNNGNFLHRSIRERSSYSLNQVTYTRTSGLNTPGRKWIFPPNAPTPTIYNYNVMLTESNYCNGIRGLRKQFSGRFRSLVTKKADSRTAIPPELKPQLKTIYVY